MKRIIHICLTDCRLIVRDRMFFFWSLVLPLVFVFVFVKAFSGVSEPVKSRLTVLHQDRGKWGDYFIGKLQRPDVEIIPVSREPASASKLLIIPPDFSEKIEKLKAQTLVLKTSSSADVKSVARAEVTVYQAIIQVLAEIVLHPDSSTFFSGRKEFQNLIPVKTSFPAGSLTVIPSGFDHQVPGTLINFMLMNAMIAGGFTLMIERRKRMLERILYSPMTGGQLWMGKFGGRMLVSWIQAAILLLAGKLLFHFRLGNFFLVLIMVLFFSLTITAISLFLGAVIRQEGLLIAIAVLVANMLAALGGCWWPIEIVGRTFRSIGMLFPTYWAMDGFHKIIFFHKGFNDLVLPCTVMLGYAFLFSLLSFRFFKIHD